MIPWRTNTGILTNRRRTLSWNGWPAADTFPKEMYFWTMAAGKVGWTSTCLIRPDAAPGIEYDPRMYERALSNQQTAVSGRRASFVLANAEQYPVPAEVDRCYFFNPFSVEILQKVMARILDSYYENPRNIQLYFYYPSDEYVAYLMTQELLMFVDEIDCGALCEWKDPREKILLFEIM